MSTPLKVAEFFDSLLRSGLGEQMFGKESPLLLDDFRISPPSKSVWAR